MASYGVKKCNYCGEKVALNSRKCPYCGSVIEVKTEEIKNETIKSSIEANEEVSKAQTSEEKYNDIQKASNVVNSITSSPLNNYNYSMQENKRKINPIGNGMKVFLTALSCVVPMIGQIAGIIIAIVFMNVKGDEDRKSFGVALLIVSIIMFVLTFIAFIILLVIVAVASS